ncbi:MAG: hypothetical protein KatS3mg108_2143 [Isosphaeraceae bacterium]|jgi:hypothetical protein|nr:MAG: hypothetical protein KatS3mg108_2143 [Isosphaeraceae bacterium]
MYGIWLVLVGLFQSARGEAAPEVVVQGSVVPLAVVLSERGVVAETGPIADQLVVRSADGTVTPLLANAASKALFLDGRLRDRPAEVRGWIHPGLPYLEPVAIRVEEAGALRTPEYYCDVCTIAVRYPQDCPCCQGPMELRFKPEP